MPKLLLIKAGSTVPTPLASRGDFEAWFLRGLGVDPALTRVIRVHEGEELPPPAEAAGVLVTGSPAMVTHRARWSEDTAVWLARVVEARVPVLGVCFGHQLLAHALGGRVGPCVGGVEIGTVELELTPEGSEDPLLGAGPGRFEVQASHWEAVLELPPGARLLATTRQDKCHAFSVGGNAWGVQFHPEFDEEITSGYLRERREKLASEGHDPDALLAGVRPTPHGAAILPRFAQIVNQQRS